MAVKAAGSLGMQGLLGSGNAIVVGLPGRFDLAEEILAAKTVKLATAFGHWSGWKSIRPSIQKSRGSIRLLTGLSFCQTEPDLLTDWVKLSRSGNVQARLFSQSKVTFHPKVLLIETSRRRTVVVGSGNLSGGGFLGNIECSLFSDSDDVFESVNAWFDRLFQDDELTSDLRDRDVTRYRKRFNAARQKNKEVQELQQDAEDEIGERHRAGLGRWKQAVAAAIRFFGSNRFKREFEEERATIGDEIKESLNYPDFDFDEEGLEKFYKIAALGHLIEVRKPRVWKQHKKLQAGLRFLIDDSTPIEKRLDSVLNKGGKYRVEGAGLNFLTKVLAVHNPLKFTVYNDPISKALQHFNYEMPRGFTRAQKYLEFARLMEHFRIESRARTAFDVDAFFYDHWEHHIKNQ